MTDEKVMRIPAGSIPQLMELPAAAIKVYLAICAASCERHHEASPNISDLAERTRLSHGAIYAAKRRLLAGGLLTSSGCSGEIPDPSCPGNGDVEEDLDDGFDDPFSPIDPSSVLLTAT